MAKQVRLTQNTVWRAFGLKPHHTESFKLPTDPFFVEKVRDIVGPYLNPPGRAMVVCVDENSQVQTLDRTQLLLPMRLGMVERCTHDWLHHGTTSLFAALDVATGKVIGACHRCHRHQEFLRFLPLLEERLPKEQDIHLSMDNYGIHKASKVRPGSRNIHATNCTSFPPAPSWLDLVEQFFTQLCDRLKSSIVSRPWNQAIMDYLKPRKRSCGLPALILF